jgi:hypothetical protein
LAEFFLTNNYLYNGDEKLVESFATVVRAIYQEKSAGRGRGSGVSSHGRGYSLGGGDDQAFSPKDFLEQLVAVAPQFVGSRQRE